MKIHRPSRLPRALSLSFFGLTRGLPQALLLLPLLLGAAAAPVPAAAQSTAPLTIVMTFPAGSGVDIVGRLLQDSMQKSLGTSIVIDYRPGAAGNVASEYVARAKPDGHTILFGTAATHGVNAALYKKLPFDVEADFTPITTIVDVSNVLTINPAVVDVKTVRELIDLVRANPGKYNYASTGNGTGTHLAMAEFVARNNLTITHVPYNGTAPALTDLLSGQVEMMFDTLGVSAQHVRSGKLKALAVGSAKRVALLPNVPTVVDAGIAGFNAVTWFGVVAPPKTSPEITAKLSAAIAEALKHPELQKRLQDLSAESVGSMPAEAAAFMEDEAERWKQVIQSANVKVD